jgi:hypothetical protein
MQWRMEPVQISPVRDFLRTYLISPAFFDKFFGGARRIAREPPEVDYLKQMNSEGASKRSGSGYRIAG